ncbi:MAG: magnesium transporter [Acholeplasmatales bacterium]|nr:MAG: magnesium transporter [Acholeplasmatales bacterium]
MEKEKVLILKEIRRLINDNQTEALKIKLHDLDEYLLADIIEILEPEKQVVVFRLLDKETALEVFEYIEVDIQQDLLQNFADEKALEFFKGLEPDDRAALMDELPAKVANKLLLSLSKKERAMTTLLMGYDIGTAGHIMTPKYISFKQGTTVQDALDKIRAVADTVETIYHLYVTDSTRKIEGMIHLKDLITADPEAMIESIMESDPIAVTYDVKDEVVSKLLQDSDLLAIPIVDKESRLLGVVTVDDAMDVLAEDAIDREFTTAGFLDFSRKESDRSKILTSGKIWEIWRVRIPFLIITLVGGMLAGLVIAGFEETLMSITALAFFIPVVMDMGGNVGTQSSTIFTRALALGHIDFKRFIKQWGREVLIGLTMGLILGFAASMIVLVWQQDARLAFVIFNSILFTVTIATALGFMVPFLMLRIGADQAAASAPFITTIKDITGLFIYFLLAYLFLM